MKKLLSLAIIGVAFTTSAFTFVAQSNWKVSEENYSVKFTSKKVDGIFKGLKADINFDENNLGNSKILATIDATSVNTGNGLRNKHARQGLGADEYPTIKFESVSIAHSGNGYVAVGKLTLKDVTKQINLPFTFKANGDGGTFSGSFSVKPKEYHVEKMGTPEEITVELNVPVKK